MDQDGELQGLQWWAGPGQDVGPGLARVASHPALPAAVRTLARGMLELAAQDQALDSVFKDGGRYIGATAAFHLNETAGLTLQALKATCLRSGLLSPGRARALLQVLEHLGCAERTSAASRAARYRLTAGFLAAWEAQLRAALTAARELEPELDLLLERADGTVVKAFGRHHAEALLSNPTGDVRAPGFLRVFVHAHAGNQIVWALLSGDDTAGFPPERTGPLSISALSRRFGVSRVHISRMFQRAVNEGLARREDDGGLHFEPQTREEIQLAYCWQLAQILAAAARAAHDHELPSAAAVGQKGAIVTGLTAH